MVNKPNTWVSLTYIISIFRKKNKGYKRNY